ncbi:MAG: tipN, partial [Brevundimonas sp.]
PAAPTPLALPPAQQARYAYAVAGVAVALWVGGVASWAAFEAGSGQAALEPLRLAVYALIALAPAGLALVLAHAVRQGAGLAAETRHARSLAEALVAPTALAAQQSGAILNTLRGDIDQALLTAERARNDMALLREALAQETNRLNEAADTATRTARRLSEQLGQERELMTGLSGDMERQAAGVLDAVERQSRMVVDASDLAQTQLREAEAALAARAADMAAAAVEAQDAARIAADDLSRQTLRLENAGTGVADQIQSVEEGLGQQRAALVTAAYALRTDQEDFSAQVESQRAQLIEQLSASRAGASELGQTSQRSAESLKELVEAASDQFRALVDMSQREADSFDNATKEALDRFEALAADARDGLVEETRRALATLEATAIQARTQAEEATEHAQLRADRLGEALFDAAQKADAAAEARIAGARRLVHETTGLVDEAGSRAEQRLENLADQLAGALARIESAIADVDQRAALLPREAEARVQAVRDTVEAGLEALSAASRKAAEDTEALDAGFQERVRRNYDMLTEAVRLMGVVSGDNAPVRRREPAAPMPEGDRGAGLRGRLRLSPVDASRQAAPSEPMD